MSERNGVDVNRLVLKEGRMYKRRDGKIVGPATMEICIYWDRWRIHLDGYSYRPDGKLFWDQESPFDIISENNED